MTQIRFEHEVKHLLVDLDGTLLGNRMFPLSVDFVSRTLVTFKRQFGSLRTGLRTLLEMRKEIDRPSPERTNDVRLIEIFSRGAGLPFDEARRVLRESALMIFPNLKRHFFPMPGAKEFLDWAKDRYPMTLATNPVWPVEVIELRLQWAGVDPRIFGKITDVRTMHACKPAPEYYSEILEHQGLSPDECLLIGNEIKMDLPAVKVGIPVFIVGDFKAPATLDHPGAQAGAWRGTYAHLRRALEKNSRST